MGPFSLIFGKKDYGILNRVRNTLGLNVHIFETPRRTSPNMSVRGLLEVLLPLEQNGSLLVK